MTKEYAIELLKHDIYLDKHERLYNHNATGIEALEMAIKALEQEPIDKSAMMYEIYMEGVNMTGEYQGCWVRFKNIEKIVNKYIGGNT